MDMHLATETAFKNGKEQGIKDFYSQIKKLAEEKNGIININEIEAILKTFLS